METNAFQHESQNLIMANQKFVQNLLKKHEINH